MAVVDETKSASGTNYKWIALSNTTLGLLMATINSSIVLIALPDIFRGIGIDPLGAGNTSYLLWMIMGFLVVTAVLVVGFGRLGDMYGRVRMYNLGFVVFTIASILLAVTWQTGDAAALWLIGWRVVQGVGGAFIMANSTAHPHRRLPRPPARHGARHQRCRGDRGLVLRPGDRRPARPGELAPDLPRVGALRHLRHDLGLPEAARQRRAQAREDGLVGQHHLRGGPHRAAGRDHLRHPALRHQHHGLGQPARADVHHRRRHRADRLRHHREPGGEPAVHALALPHPRLHPRQHRDPALLARPGWAAVHPDHLAAGRLAAAARLQLRPDPAVGGHLHAAADGRVPPGRTGVGVPVRPVGGALVLDRRHGPHGDQLHPAGSPADQLRLLGLRGRPARVGHRHGPVHLARTGPRS